MAREPKPVSRERSAAGQAKGRRLPLGKRPWQLERTGGGFSVPIDRPRGADGLKRLKAKETLTQRRGNRNCSAGDRPDVRTFDEFRENALTEWQRWRVCTIRYAAHHSEHKASARRRSYYAHGRLLQRRAGTHRPLAGRCRAYRARLTRQRRAKDAVGPALCDNRHPQTGKRLTRTHRHRSHGRLRFQLPRAQECLAALCHDAR